MYFYAFIHLLLVTGGKLLGVNQRGSTDKAARIGGFIVEICHQLGSYPPNHGRKSCIYIVSTLHFSVSLYSMLSYPTTALKSIPSIKLEAYRFQMCDLLKSKLLIKPL